MLGQATAALSPANWLYRVWGSPDIHARQKWRVVWPKLERLPERGIRLLDAGCGTGAWTLELAARRPSWRVTGIDRDESAVALAERNRKQLGLENASFGVTDFLAYQPPEAFDVVLSVASAHYLMEAGSGPELFSRFRDWLKPGGLLLVFGPRKADEAPVTPLLRRPPMRRVFSSEQLQLLCRGAELKLETITPCIGAAGTLAKQIALTASGSRITTALFYPLTVLLTLIDGHGGAPAARSYSWLVAARWDETGKQPL